MRTRALAPVLFVLLTACGASTPPPAPAPPPPAPPPTTAMVPAEAPPDLSPVAEPKNLVLLGRLKNTQASLRGFDAALKLPVSIESVISKEIGDPEFESVLKADSSIDVAVLIDPAAKEPDFNVAFSLPLKSFEQAKALAERDGKLTKVKPGVFRLGGVRGKTDLVCNLAMSLGEAPARIVCSPRDRDLDALVPWMTRGLPTVAASASDLHIEGRFAPVEEKFGPFLRDNAGRVRSMAAAALAREFGVKDPSVADLAADLAQEGIATSAELDGFVLDASVDGKTPSASSKGTLKLKGTKSFMARVFSMAADRAGTAPPMFLQLPKDATSASFAFPIDQKIWTGARAQLAKAMGGLSRSVLADADASAIESVFAKIPLLDAKVVVSASGDGSPAKPHRMTKKTPQEVILATKEKVQSTVGWHVIGFEGKADELTAFFRETAATYNRKSIQERLKKEMRSDTSLLPTARFGNAAGFPAGSSALTIDVALDSKRSWYTVPSPDGKFEDHPAGKAATGTAGITIVIVPDGAHTWVLFGTDTAVLKKRLAEVKSPKGDQTLQTRDGIDLLKSTKATSASFATLEPAIRAAEQAVSAMGKDEDVKRLIAGLPNKGKTPLLFIGTAGGGANPSMTVEMQIQKGTFEDAAALIMGIMAMKHSGGSAPPVEAMPAPPPAVAPRMTQPKKK